jgi:hypothetical protein
MTAAFPSRFLSHFQAEKKKGVACRNGRDMRCNIEKILRWKCSAETKQIVK